jgi:CRISPR-associated endonuclease/helicase Cas3
MASVPNDYAAWGKLQRDGQSIRTHPLIDHMLDVAACFTELCECQAIRRAMHSTAGRELDEADLARLAVLAFLHDIGKANAGFQSRRWATAQDGPKTWPRTPNGHGAEAWALVTRNVGAVSERVMSGLPLSEFAAWGANAFFRLLQASISHHGRPVLDDPLKQAADIWQPVRSESRALLYDPATVIAAMGGALHAAYPNAFSPTGKELPDTPAFEHLFAGLVQLADWIGSDTREGFFTYSQDGEDRVHTSRQRAQRAVNAIGLSADPWRKVLRDTPPQFADVFNVAAPRPMQAEVADPTLGRLVVLEAETGSGKTEAALWRFARLFQDGAVDGLFFALPTRVSASQLYERVRTFVKRVWPNDAPVVVRALPGYEAADGEAKTPGLAPFEVLWTDRPDDHGAHRRWAAESPKRFLAATIAVGTIDQALLGALRVRHAHLRHALLSRSLLVVDEVHASDAYMTTLLEQLLKAHIAAGGHALLLSATLGAAARSRYLNIGLRGLDQSPPPLDRARAMAYPAISYQADGQIDVKPVDGNPQHKTVHWSTWDVIDSPAAVASMALDAAKAGAKVLVVRNTVPAAVRTLQAIEALIAEQPEPAHDAALLFKVGEVSTLHHSRFSRQDRPLLDSEVAARFGKDRSKTGGCILVGTQTLEQSLDIDADLLITDLCPMDVLLQRVGRLHRHARALSERPSGYHEARVWVVTPTGNDLSPMLARARNGMGRMRDGGGVYRDLRILEATRRLIEAQPCRIIPAENRILVEEATHPEALESIAALLGADWQTHGQSIDGDALAKTVFADMQSVSYDKEFDTQGFPDGERKLATRLGTADRIVEFDPPQPGPFGHPVTQLSLRFHQLPKGLPVDAQAGAIVALANEPGFEFTLGTSRYRYSRLGLERLSENAP